jgi:formylglycine-generating enzyme required for sulfatase activity
VKALQSNDVNTLERDSADVVTRWEVPEEVLGLASDWQDQNGQTLTLAMPAEERAWRDAAHYKAYVRPTETYKITEAQ